jgi:Fatty acid desaturase
VVALGIGVGLGVWWTSNTVAHNFIHRPFFRARTANRLFALWLSAAVGIPQSLWRDRHLAHHAGVPPRMRASAELILQVAVVLSVWTILLVYASRFFVVAYLPGYAAGLLLCAVHGHYEHRGGTTSHYGRVYNLLFMNDGYHVEHHAWPGVPWTDLPKYRRQDARVSRWPAPLRWLDALDLNALERLVLEWPWLQRYVLRVHARALESVLSEVRQPVHSAAVVGGALFPRTAIVLRQIYPAAQITIIDASREHLECARRFIEDLPPEGGSHKRARGSHKRVRGSHERVRGSHETRVVVASAFRRKSATIRPNEIPAVRGPSLRPLGASAAS